MNEPNWPDKKLCSRTCFTRISANEDCDCGAKQWNLAIDACKKAYDEAQKDSHPCTVCGKEAVVEQKRNGWRCQDHVLIGETQPKGLVAKEICDTTSTERLPKIVCKGCGTYKDNLGPCKTFCQGGNERCSYCDHDLKCHPIAWHLIETLGSTPKDEVMSVEEIEKIIFDNPMSGHSSEIYIKHTKRLAQAINQRLTKGKS